MRSEKKSYVAVLASGVEYFLEAEPGNPRSICEEAVRNSGLKTSRKSPQMINVELFAIEISQGQLKRRKVVNCEVYPPFARMTSEEFAEIQENLVEDLPDEFQAYVRQTAWERGHSSGYEEVAQIVGEMVGDLAPVVQTYTNRILDFMRSTSVSVP